MWIAGRLLYFLLGFILCFVSILGFGIVSEQFRWQKEIDPLALASLVVTTSIAILVSIYLPRERSRASAKIDLISARLDKVAQTLADIQAGVGQQALQLAKGNRFRKEMTQLLSSVWLVADLCDLRFSQDKDDIERDIKELHTLLTHTPVDPENGFDISVSEGMYRYAGSRLQEIEVCVRKMEQTVLGLQLDAIQHIQ